MTLIGGGSSLIKIPIVIHLTMDPSSSLILGYNAPLPIVHCIILYCSLHKHKYFTPRLHLIVFPAGPFMGNKVWQKISSDWPRHLCDSISWSMSCWMVAKLIMQKQKLDLYSPQDVISSVIWQQLCTWQTRIFINFNWTLDVQLSSELILRTRIKHFCRWGHFAGEKIVLG